MDIMQIVRDEKLILTAHVLCLVPYKTHLD